jgi:hypothetical protein
MSTGTSIPTGPQTGEGTKEQGQQAAGQVQDKAQQAAGQAQEKGQQAAAQAKDKLREQLDQRSSQAAEQINQQASDLRAVGDSLREQGKDGPAKAVDRVAEYVEKTGGYLRDKDSEAMLTDAEDFARRQPWAVGAGALALGFVASRFLKASSRKRYSSRSADQPVGTRRGVAGSNGQAPATSPTLGLPPAPGSTPPIGV